MTRVYFKEERGRDRKSSKGNIMLKEIWEEDDQNRGGCNRE